MLSHIHVVSLAFDKVGRPFEIASKLFIVKDFKDLKCFEKKIKN